MASSKAVVGVEAFNLDFVVLAPVVYLFLDQSMAAESWYYVYRYLYGTAADKISPPANTGPVSGSPGRLTLISSNIAVQPNNGFFSPCMLPKSQGAMPLQGVGKMSLSKINELLGNPMLVQISLGNAPVVGVSSAW